MSWYNINYNPIATQFQKIVNGYWVNGFSWGFFYGTIFGVLLGIFSSYKKKQ